MKRMNVRSSFVIALLLALILPILAVCGGGTSAATEATPAPAAPTAAAPAHGSLPSAPPETADAPELQAPSFAD